ncbi:RNB-domain-containing protein [Whalleya microplaca]|nr:RNB-domain-containing protein [Whalleya microplaca]
MLKTSSRSYVCWRCAFRTVRPDATFARSNVTSLQNATPNVQVASSIPIWRRSLATVQHPASDRDASDEPLRAEEGQKEKRLPIRERLRKWDEEHRDAAKSILTDIAYVGELSNSFTRPQNVSMAQFDVSSPLFSGDELEDLRSDDAVLKLGDMVEMSSEGSRRPMMAICLGRINGYEHFYTSSGKWFTGLGIKTLFVVKEFAEPAELEAVIAELPSNDTPTELINTLRDLGHSPSRSAGASLLRKMLQFSHDSEAVYQANAGTLDAASAFIGDPVKHRYLTLHEIATLLLPESYQNHGNFRPIALYAVHRALMQDEAFFRPLRQAGHRSSYLFEISPLSEVRVVQNVENMVRKYLENETRRLSGHTVEASPIHGFITTARSMIDQSRKNRKWTNNGIIGPSASSTTAITPTEQQWSPTDLELLQFMELWACYQKFPNYSRLQCLGSTILRALDRYQDAEALTPSAGWTFLQEVGWIPPWEIPARYKVRFPDVEIQRGGGYVRPWSFPGTFDEHLKGDAFKSTRKILKDLTVYCIDAESTTDIDDGVSVERTSNPSQYWVHVHVADPASSIMAGTPVAQYAELIPQTIYLPGHFERMLPDKLSQERFSLAPNRPTLTFSALVDKDGNVLDQKITPGTLEKVVYMTGEDVASAIEEHRQEPIEVGGEISLGPIPRAQPPERVMTRPGDLTKDQKNELALLRELGTAIQAKRLSKGATPFYLPRPSVEAFFDRVSHGNTDSFASIDGDPSIRVTYQQSSGTDLVSHIMQLAGEVAARWCHERGIPIPYRTQPYAMRNAALVQQYTRDVFYPLLNEGTRPADHHWRQLRALLGNDAVSTTAGPHFTLGVDMYTKATSPLRRYSDLIVHWQIEAALLEEERRGSSLVGNTYDSFLPFTRERLDRMLPMLRLREKQASSLSNQDGNEQWILQALVRAWRFGEAELPETFRFTVVHVAGRQHILGRLNWFEQPALLRADALNDLAKMADVCYGDVFEVKLKDVNVHSKQILVEAVGMLEKAESGRPPVALADKEGASIQAETI